MLDATVPQPRFEPAAPAPGSPRCAAFYSVATAVPPARLTTAEVAARLGVGEEWILSRTGVRERPVAGPRERLSDYAAQAGAAALERAAVAAEDVDLVLVATLTPDEITPNAAPLVAHAIGATRAGAFDVGAACTGFLSALAVAAAQIEAARCRYVLVIGADFCTRITDWEDRKTAPLFGDAAGAAVIGPAGGGAAIGPVVLGADGSHGATIVIPTAERKVRMDGPEVYRNAVARMWESTLEAVERAGLTLADIDLFVYHQANARITRALGERLGVGPERVVDCIEYLGNSSAATLPLGLQYALSDGRLRPGRRVLRGAPGGALTWGAAVAQWGSPADA
jgi:3-oxoacyl-[acyl-carrier-protein] synthase-3